MIRKGVFKDQHFDQNLNFMYIEVDKVTERVSQNYIKFTVTFHLEIYLLKYYYIQIAQYFVCVVD